MTAEARSTPPRARAPATAPPRELAPATRAALRATSVLVALAGIQLFVLAERTDRFFAWTIEPPITAAWLGANFLASLVLQALAARQARWSDARVAVPGVLAFTLLTDAATLAHHEYLRASNPFACIWVAVYAVAPVALGGVLIAQRRTPVRAEPRARPAPRPLRALLAAQAAVLLPVGVALVCSPARAEALFWPWRLTPPGGDADDSMAGYVGAWLVGLAVVAAQAAWERELARQRVVYPSMLCAGILQLVVLARYAGAVRWSAPSAAVYLAVVVSMVAGGAAGVRATRLAQPPS